MCIAMDQSPNGKAITPALATVGQAVHITITANQTPATASHSAPCQRRTTKSSSKLARAQIQTSTGRWREVSTEELDCLGGVRIEWRPAL